MCLPDPHTRATHARIHSKPFVARAVGERAVERRSTTSSVLYGAARAARLSNQSAATSMPATPHTVVTLRVQSWIYGVAQLRWSVPPMPVPVIWSRHPCESREHRDRIPFTVPPQYPYRVDTLRLQHVRARIVIAYVRARARVCIRAPVWLRCVARTSPCLPAHA
jgi:hypothetical protein